MEQKNITTLLHACRKIYDGEMIILSPYELLQVNLAGNTDEELRQSLQCFAQDLYELIHEDDLSPSGRMDFRFVRQLCSVVRTQLSPRRMYLILQNYVKHQ